MTKRHLNPFAATALCLGLAVGCTTMKSEDSLPEPVLTGDAKLTILQTTDVHHTANGMGHATATAPASEGSYARIAAYVNYVRANAGNPVVLVDSGDWSMGTLYDLTLGQQPAALYFMDTLRYNCITIGNHEFDYTPLGLATMLHASQGTFSFHTPMVASNVLLNGNTDLAPYFGAGKTIQPSWTETLPNGLKVGYIGLLGKAAAATAPASAPVSFRDFSTSYTFVQDLVNDLRTNQKCNVVVALSHSGANAQATAGEDVDLAKHVTGIDVIASGHNHNPLPAAVTVANGAWNTQIVCAGAYGTNVARVDLTYHFNAKNTTVDTSSNLSMDATRMAACGYPASGDPAFLFIVGATDAKLNENLAPLFTPIFPDFSAANPATGLYHAVGATAQDMTSNDKNPVLCPNGLGNLCADADRAVPNAIIAQTLAAVGGNPANLPGFDFTPFQASVIATGVIRGTLRSGIALNFSDIYNTLPLGISPDSTQPLPVGYPLISAYIDLADIKKVCALQLVAQCNLASSDYYLNLSGLSYTLKATENNAFFKHATAAAVLNVTSQKATAGSPAAGTAMAALGQMGTDGGAAMMAAIGAGNTYATAMGKLNDADLTGAAANLAVLGQVATLAATDAATGTKTLNALIVSKAIAAIDTVSGFAPTDPACTGTATVLTGASRIRLSADLYAVLMMDAAQTEFGANITAWATPTGTTDADKLSSANMARLMANRIDLDPATAGTQELKEWMALLQYLTAPAASGGLEGLIPTAYASSTDFSQWWLAPGSFGTAVTTRNASYPYPNIGGLMAQLQTLMAAP